MKVTIVLPLKKETKGALLYQDENLSQKNPLFVADGIYLRKAGVQAAHGSYPKEITLTVEAQS